MTTPTSNPGANIEVDLQATNPRGFDVTEDYVLESRAGDIPDSVVSRTDDNDTIDKQDESNGLVFNSGPNYGSIGARISSLTSGVTRARLYDYDVETYIETVDISSLSSGDAFAFDSNIKSGQDYGIELDAEGDGYTDGFREEENYDYTTADVDIAIVAQSRDGTKRSASIQAVNDIGNPDGILD